MNAVIAAEKKEAVLELLLKLQREMAEPAIGLPPIVTVEEAE